MDTWNILIGALLGVIGMGYIIYGRNQMHAMPVITGIVLCIFPYFVPQIWITLLLAAGIMALPRFVHF